MMLKINTEVLSKDQNRLWNSNAFYQEYQNHGGAVLSCSQLVDTVSTHFGCQILVLSSPGYIHIITFHKQSAKLLKVLKDNTGDDDNNPCINKLAMQIINECKLTVMDRATSALECWQQYSSGGCLTHNYIGCNFPKLNNFMPAILIGSMVTAASEVSRLCSEWPWGFSSDTPKVWLVTCTNTG